VFFFFHVMWVPCHHGVARAQVADEGDSLQIWRLAAKILNKQSRTADKGWFSSLKVGCGANNSSLYKMKLVRSMHRAGSLKIVGEEISKYGLDLMGIQEVRWDRGGAEPND
jgi:hypothetical protein